MLQKRYIWVGQRLHAGRKAGMQSEGRFCIVGKGYITVVLTYIIVIGSQLMMQGRTKIIQGIDIKHIGPICVSILCSREVA